MTFFLTNSPEDREAEGQASTSSHSAKSRPLFKQDDDLPDTLAGEHISLSAYISKHLQGNNNEDFIEEEPAPSAKAKPRTFPTPTYNSNSNQQKGLLLNRLDVEMPSGLEQYLPSPIFRLRVAKRRLDGEINLLRQRLAKYERLPNPAPDLQKQIALLKKQLISMEAHQAEISRQLSSNLGLLPTTYAMLQQGRTLGSLGHWLTLGLQKLRILLITVFYGRAFLNLLSEGDEMEALKELYAERLKAGNGDEAELSAILNRFEQIAQRAEADARKVKKNSFKLRLWQDTQGLVK